MPLTFDALKLDISKNSNEVQLSNMPFISTTFDVSKFDKLIYFN